MDTTNAFYRVTSFQSGTTWVATDKRDVMLHIGYYLDGKPTHPDALLRDRGLSEKSRLAHSLCKCLNEAHAHLEGDEPVCPYICGMTTAHAEIQDDRVFFDDAYFGTCKCDNFKVTDEWTPLPFPEYFIRDLKFVLEKILKNSKDD